MVSVTSNPYAYVPPPVTPKAASASSSAQTGSTGASSATDTASALASSLLNGGNSFSPEVLSLLQQNGSGSFDPISSLLGGSSHNNNALTNLYASLYSGVTAAAITIAKDNVTQQQAGGKQADFAQNLISGLSQASVAYNKTNLQNAANVLKANSYNADGVTPLVA